MAWGSCISAHVQDHIPDLICARLIEIACELEPPPDHDLSEGEYEADDDRPYPELAPNVSVPKLLPPRPNFYFKTLQVAYFDIFGTLIDKEAGVFEALKPLFSCSAYQFDRNEAVSFYLESESEAKKRAPGAPYAHILSDAYHDVAFRLGIESTTSASALFAQSIAHWPLFPHAEWCLAILRTIPGLSIAAIADVDRDSLLRSSAFTALAPYFDTMFTWDACRAYKPDLTVFKNPLSYYEALGAWRLRTLCIPGIWMRYPQSLAATARSWERACPSLTVGNLVQLAAAFLLYGPWTPLAEAARKACLDPENYQSGSEEVLLSDVPKDYISDEPSSVDGWP
ncbi:hypothetical protein B0H14DRAFT_3003663 [Mycena olivaceomarginata]|nr:hypothetical protein B0H14DRAFT_3003663 [Mycena olivaceomarginata]